MLKSKTKRIFYLGFAWLCFAVGFVGAFLPVLPTTPFMLLALWGFSKGSVTLHTWLYNHPKFGETLQYWDQYGVIPIKAKITAISMMTVSALILIFFTEIPQFGILSAIGLMLIGAVFVLTRPSTHPLMPQKTKPDTDSEKTTDDETDNVTDINDT